MNQPLFNIPRAILWFVALFLALHLTIYWGDIHDYLIISFAFNPKTTTAFTTLTYAFLHSDWNHLLLNSAMFVAFGSAIAKRFSSFAFIIFTLTLALAGSLAHYLAYAPQSAPVIGASAITSGLFGACLRLPNFGTGENALAKYLSLKEVITSKIHLFNIAFWLATNYLFGAGLLDITGDGARIAWQAHVGGFVAGFATIALLPTKRP